MKKQSKSSKRWLKEHFNDPFVQKAKKEGWRSRASYKLIEIQEKDRLLKPGMTVVDLGSAPGGWSQVAVKQLGKKGKLFALDLLDMDPIAGVEFLQADFLADSSLTWLLAQCEGKAPDVVLSDLAPNASGVASADQARAMALVEIALDFVQRALAPGGSFLVKTFQGEGWDGYLKNLRTCFEKVIVRKPEASRARSKEVYLLARGFLG